MECLPYLSDSRLAVHSTLGHNIVEPPNEGHTAILSIAGRMSLSLKLTLHQKPMVVLCTEGVLISESREVLLCSLTNSISSAELLDHQGSN